MRVQWENNLFTLDPPLKTSSCLAGKPWRQTRRFLSPHQQNPRVSNFNGAWRSQVKQKSVTILDNQLKLPYPENQARPQSSNIDVPLDVDFSPVALHRGSPRWGSARSSVSGIGNIIPRVTARVFFKGMRHLYNLSVFFPPWLLWLSILFPLDNRQT